MSHQGEARVQRATHRGRRGRRPAATDDGTGGPIRPRKKKPPPTPSGELCGYGLCCHFGTDCVNLHTVEDTEFFKEQANLKLRLREMALQQLYISLYIHLRTTNTITTHIIHHSRRRANANASVCCCCCCCFISLARAVVV